MFDLLLAAISGGIIGWLASMVMNRDAAMGVVANVVVGCLGSALGRAALGLVPGGVRLDGDPFDWRVLLAGLAGAVLLLAAANLIQRGRLR